ncbi:MAG: chemotaxis protein CheC, partial [Deltaproteobacteria bacterium]|nr:chemotaxis protein CheC [Deltaproteobacteria bacterium]
VGNILLTACLGTFGIVLDVNVTFAVPRMRMEAISNFIDSLHIDDQRIQTCLIVS